MTHVRILTILWSLVHIAFASDLTLQDIDELISKESFSHSCSEGNESSCTRWKLECSANHVILIKGSEGVEQGELMHVYEQCSGHQSCTVSLTANGVTPAISYYCIQDTEIVHFCEAVEKTGQLVHIFYNARTTNYDDGDCVCTLSVEAGIQVNIFSADTRFHKEEPLRECSDTSLAWSDNTLSCGAAGDHSTFVKLDSTGSAETSMKLKLGEASASTAWVLAKAGTGDVTVTCKSFDKRQTPTTVSNKESVAEEDSPGISNTIVMVIVAVGILILLIAWGVLWTRRSRLDKRKHNGQLEEPEMVRGSKDYFLDNKRMLQYIGQLPESRGSSFISRKSSEKGPATINSISKGISEGPYITRLFIDLPSKSV